MTEKEPETPDAKWDRLVAELHANPCWPDLVAEVQAQKEKDKQQTYPWGRLRNPL